MWISFQQRIEAMPKKLLKNDFKCDSGIIGDNRVSPTVWVQSNYILRAIFMQSVQMNVILRDQSSKRHQALKSLQLQTKWLPSFCNKALTLGQVLISLPVIDPHTWEVIIRALMKPKSYDRNILSQRCMRQLCRVISFRGKD